MNGWPPEDLAHIRDGGEPVVVEIAPGIYRAGMRGKGLYRMGACIGSLTATEDDEVFHSMMGAKPTFDATQLAAEIAKTEAKLTALRAAQLSLSP